MKLWVFTLVLPSVLFGAPPDTAGLRAAAQHYEDLLRRSADAEPYQLYARIVTPLANLYRALGDTANLESLLERRIATARPGVELALAQADLGFHYQDSDTSADRYHGERFVAEALAALAACSDRADCRSRLAEMGTIQGAVFFQQRRWTEAEALLRRTLDSGEDEVGDEVLLVAVRTLRTILVQRGDWEEARRLELRAALLEARNPSALARIRTVSQVLKSPTD